MRLESQVEVLTQRAVTAEALANAGSQQDAQAKKVPSTVQSYPSHDATEAVRNIFQDRARARRHQRAESASDLRDIHTGPKQVGEP